MRQKINNNLFIITLFGILALLASIFFTYYTYNTYNKRAAGLTTKFNEIVYEFYINMTRGNVTEYYDFSIINSGIIKDVYIYNKREDKLIHFINEDRTIILKSEPVENIKDVDLSKSFDASNGTTIYYDKKNDIYSIVILNLFFNNGSAPVLYRSIGFNILFFISILALFITLHRRLDKNTLDNKLLEVANTYKDATFIVSNFNHEVNTPMLEIETLLFKLKHINKECNADTCDLVIRIANSLEDCVNTIKNNIELTSNVKILSKRNKIRDIYEALKKIENTLKLTSSPVIVNIDESLRGAPMDLSEPVFYSVFTNLFKNSYEAEATQIDILFENEIMTIKDNGHGIREIDPKDIFKKVSSKTNKGIERGFGTFFIKTILNKTGYNIELKNTSTQGTEFIITRRAD